MDGERKKMDILALILTCSFGPTLWPRYRGVEFGKAQILVTNIQPGVGEERPHWHARLVRLLPELRMRLSRTPIRGRLVRD